MLLSSARLLTVVSLLPALATPVFGQGGATSSISGVVKDRAGGVIPGASVTVTRRA